MSVTKIAPIVNLFDVMTQSLAKYFSPSNTNLMNQFLHFHKNQRQGILIFSLLLFGAFAGPNYYQQYVSSAAPNLSWIALEFQESDLRPQPSQGSNQKTRKDSLFAFDPNKVDVEQMRLLGFTNRIAKTIVNYRAKGGRFYKSKDMLKIYGMDTAFYFRLEPFIQLERPLKRNYKKYASQTRTKKQQSLAINSASAEEWQKLRGIGPVLSKRIVKFRDRLGGFHQVDQVGQTYGLPDSTFLQIRPQLTCSGVVTPIDVNRLAAKQLAAHPYLGRKEAQLLTSYRQMHGDYKNFDMLKSIKGVPEGYFDRLKPYLLFAEQ